MKIKRSLLSKKLVINALAILGLGLFATAVFAAPAGGDTNTLGAVAENINQGFSNVAKLITGAAFVAGLCLAVIAIFKFKAHRDNPMQVPIGTPIALLFIGAALIFTPSLFGVLGQTIFGKGATAGQATGTVTIKAGGK